MNMLWLVNIVLPEAGEKLNINYSVFGGWLTGALNGIRNSVDSITVAAIGGKDICKLIECDVGNVHYAVFPPMGRKGLEKAFSDYLADHQFDIIHIFGTEMEHSAAMISVAPPEKTVVNLQGLCYAISQHYLEGIPNKYVNHSCIKKVIRSIIRRFEEPAMCGYEEFCKAGDREIALLKKAQYVIGRTNWDRSCVTQINPYVRYFHVNETLRDSFCTDQAWLPEKCERHSVFLSQASYPIKGLHYFVRALAIIKRFYPDVKVYVGGRCGIAKREGIRLKKDRLFSGYFGYVNTLIADNNLYDCFHVLGFMNEEQMADRYLKSNVFVCPSTIENSPNSVGEAMMLGTPVVASYVGGIPDMLDNGKEGLLYQSSAPYMLADCIMRIFADDDLAMTLSKNAITRAHITHDKEKNAKALLDVYNEIIKETEGK